MQDGIMCISWRVNVQVTSIYTRRDSPQSWQYYHFANMHKTLLALCLLARHAFADDQTWGLDTLFSNDMSLQGGEVCILYEYIMTVVVEPTATSPQKYITMTEPYEGTTPITAPIITTKSKGSGTETIVVETSVYKSQSTTQAKPTPSYVTITTVYTGTSPISEPITTTVPPRRTKPGTVIIETPETSSSSSSAEPTTVPTEMTSIAAPPQRTSTTTTKPKTSTTIPKASGPTFSCDTGGFLVQRNTLYRLDLETGANPVVNAHVGSAGNVNAMGYNVLDNFLYAFISIGQSRQQLIRIDANGKATKLPLIVPSGLNVGDVDENGQFWVSARGSRFQQINLAPGTPKYGEVVDEGSPSGTPVADWVYLENGGDYLYSIRLGSTATAVRWSRTDHTWHVVKDYGRPTGGHSGFGALYAVGDELWGSDNQTGDIIAFPVLGNGPARKITAGPKTDSNDGARCFRAPAP